MISDKTVDLLTRTREFCEKIADVGIGENDRDALIGTAETLDVLTDIMNHLMNANAIEQAALSAKSSDFRSVGDVIEALKASTELLNNTMKENVN